MPEKDLAKKAGGKPFSWNQIQPMLDTFAKENERVEKVEASNRTAFDNAIAKMEQRLQLYATLKNTVQPGNAQDWPAELAAYEQLIPEGVAAATAQQAGEKFNQTNFNTFIAYVQEFQLDRKST